MDLTVRAANDLASVDPAAWNGLDHGASPFLEHGFLRALEVSQSIGPEAGWAPVYLLAEVAEKTESGATGARLLGAVPCFIKSHSYGEYIFDWGWARAASRAGIPYYPKLVIAAPVTPATGRRILLRRDMQDADRRVVALALVEAARALADAADCSSIHWLFTTEDEHALLAEAGFMSRLSFQFHFRNEKYADFEAFLATLASRKRKQIRKERRRALESVDRFEFVPGSEWSDHDVDVLDRFYRSTVNRHYGQDYLQPGFFHELRRWLPDRVQFARAQQGGDIVAGALYFETDQALYGRYWGCSRQIEFLHFETAYYAGIERCIQRGLPLFEAGAQGEHKLLRGFAPAPTFSSHSIRHPALRDAVRRFLEEEANALPSYMKELQQFTPYKSG